MRILNDPSMQPQRGSKTRSYRGTCRPAAALHVKQQLLEMASRELKTEADQLS